ncbi:MAG: glycosyltransferase family 2 protein [Saccharofermentanales bacterium]|jgi:glycosyltransferase involved in cell wall biosynthesis
MPLFSIITVCFDASESIVDTMKSVYGQTYDSFEYIIVDGLSTDDTLQLINNTKKIYDVRETTRIVSEKDDGIYDAMNNGVRYSSGRYCCFMNAGDTFVSPDVLLRLAESIENHKYGYIYGDVYSVSKTFKKYVMAQSMDAVSKSLNMPYCHQALFISRDFVLNHPFDLKYRNAADYNQCIQLFKSGAEYLHADVTIANYQIGGKSESDALSYFDEKIEIRKINGFTHPTQMQSRIIRFKIRMRILIKRILPTSVVELIRRFKA